MPALGVHIQAWRSSNFRAYAHPYRELIQFVLGPTPHQQAPESATLDGVHLSPLLKALQSSLIARDFTILQVRHGSHENSIVGPL